MSKSREDAFYEIGFNDDVASGGRRLHVQTEVVAPEPLEIRSAVIERGAVKHVESCTFPDRVVDLDQARDIVDAQHRSVVDRVARGEIG